LTTLLAVHSASTWFMVGLIWTIQVVHYPLFHAVGAGSFSAYEAQHTRRIGTLLIIPAAVEATTAGALLVVDPGAVTLVAAGVLAAIWTMTAFVHAPLHGRLTPGYDRSLVSRLVVLNRWRTGAWTLRGGLAIGMLLVL
jgi:hypothetical protein